MNKSSQNLLEKTRKLTSDELAESISLPLQPSSKLDLRSNIPLNRCKAFSVSASIGALPLAGESAIREEQMAWHRQQNKIQKVEEFFQKTQERVKAKKHQEKEKIQKNIDEIAFRFNKIKEQCVNAKIGVLLGINIDDAQIADDEEEVENSKIQEKKEKNSKKSKKIQSNKVEKPNENEEKIKIESQIKNIEIEKESTAKFSSYAAVPNNKFNLFGQSNKALEISSEGLEEIKEDIEVFYEKNKKRESFESDEKESDAQSPEKMKKKQKKEKKDKKNKAPEDSENYEGNEFSDNREQYPTIEKTNEKKVEKEKKDKKEKKNKKEKKDKKEKKEKKEKNEKISSSDTNDHKEKISENEELLENEHDVTEKKDKKKKKDKKEKKNKKTKTKDQHPESDESPEFSPDLKEEEIPSDKEAIINPFSPIRPKSSEDQSFPKILQDLRFNTGKEDLDENTGNFFNTGYPPMVTSVLSNTKTAILASTAPIKHSVVSHEIVQVQAKVTAKFKVTQEKCANQWNPTKFDENSLRIELVRKIADINEHHSSKNLRTKSVTRDQIQESDITEKGLIKNKPNEKSEKRLRFMSVENKQKEFGPNIKKENSKKDEKNSKNQKSQKNLSKSPKRISVNEVKVEENKQKELNYSTRHLEQLRFSAALKTMVRDKMKEKFTDDIPAVCTCGAMNRRKNLKNPVQCANNCPFYKRQQEFQRALSEMLQSFKASQ